MSTITSHLLTLPDFLAADVSRSPSAAARFRLGDAAAAAATPADNNRAAGAYQSWNRGITIATSRALDATPIVSNISHNSSIASRDGKSPIFAFERTYSKKTSTDSSDPYLQLHYFKLTSK